MARCRPLHRPNQPKQNRYFQRTQARLTARRLGAIAPVRKKSCLNFLDRSFKIALIQFPDLAKELKQLVWLSLDFEEEKEYSVAMDLTGQYAAAIMHACIHRHIAENLGAQLLFDLENPHNVAWK